MENLSEKVNEKKDSFNPYAQFDILSQTYERSLDANWEKQEEWTKHKDELCSVRSHIESLPNELSYDVMIPIGSEGLMRGKLVHTNEILALIGDNWYIKTSAKHAAEICQRRIERCENRLTEYEKEREIIKTWRATIHEVFHPHDENAREIYEEYDDEKEKEWRDLHRENVRKHYLDLAKLRNPENKTTAADDEALQRRLDELEREEEMEDELIRSGKDLDECATSSEADENEPADENNTEIHSQNLCEGSHPKRRVSFSEVVQEVDLKTEEEENPEPLKIYFRHSDATVNAARVNRDENVQPSPSELASPSDVYTHFASLFPNKSTPKGILKQTSTSSSVEENSEGMSNSYTPEWLQDRQFETGTGDPDVSIEGQENDSVQPQAVAFGDVILEHNPEAEPPIPDNVSQVTRPVSRFKASRQKKKN